MDEGDTTSNISSLAGVPPYLNNQYSPLTEVFQAHSTTLPSKHTPESNSDAVIRSLKALQEKIRSLEVERVAAGDRFKVLSQGTNTTPLPTTRTPTSTVGMVTDRGPSVGASPLLTNTTPHSGLKFRLDSLDERLSQQAQELDAMQMKLRLSNTHTPPHTLHTPSSPRPAHMMSDCQCLASEQKLRSLEQGVHRLKEAQNKTKERVEELETCVKSSPRRGCVSHDLVGGGNPPQAKKRTKPKPKKGKTVTCQRVQSAPTCSDNGLAVECLPRPTPGVHYRLNMGHLPFILGSSTAPSHSVCANYQQVLSLMKSHNHLLCGAASLRGKRGTGQGRRKSKGISVTELEALLEGLEEEYGALTFEHQALTRHLQDDTITQKPRMRASLELQLTHSEEQLQSKSEQIRIVSKQLSAGGCVKSEETVALREEATSQTQLCFLKKMKALQSTLQRDDLNWK